MSQTILVTGGAGFVGSNLSISLKKHHPDYDVWVLDNLKRRGSELNLPRLREHGVNFVHGDIRNREDLEGLGQKFTLIIEASAEPSVMAGVHGSPDYLINTNLLGTINCLELARKCDSGFLFLSTSRVYPIEALESIRFQEGLTRFEIDPDQVLLGISQHGISEQFPLDGYRSLYGASKLASELIIQEYAHFYQLPAIINRCGVITGPWQMGKVDQGVMVLWVARHFWQKPLKYIGYGGTGKQVRDVLDVRDLFDLIDYQIQNLEKHRGALYNVGGGPDISFSLQELTRVCEELSGNVIDIGSEVETRSADIRMYLSDNRKVHSETGWQPKIKREQIIQDIYTWINEHESTLRQILN